MWQWANGSPDGMMHNASRHLDSERLILKKCRKSDEISNATVVHPKKTVLHCLLQVLLTHPTGGIECEMWIGCRNRLQARRTAIGLEIMAGLEPEPKNSLDYHGVRIGLF
jgi:hypothetical protein